MGYQLGPSLFSNLVLGIKNYVDCTNCNETILIMNCWSNNKNWYI